MTEPLGDETDDLEARRLRQASEFFERRLDVPAVIAPIDRDQQRALRA
jgi:hypothetical protein